MRVLSAWLWFFVFAPGIGVQYFAWLAPFLVVAAPRAYAAHLATATVFLAIFYHTASDGRFPWIAAVPKTEHVAWLIAGGVCWAVLAVMMVVLNRRWVADRGEVADSANPVLV